MAGGCWSLAFAVAGADAVAFPVRAAGERADELWTTTCFELFVKPGAGEGYCEFNFSPSTAWAAYGFEGYRAGRSDLPTAAPRVERTAEGVRATVDLSELPQGVWRVGLSAVIEEADGTKSFWALAHPPGKPDFHHPDCFVLELPPAIRP